MKKVIVFGSINMDLAVTVPYLPSKGETLTGNNFNLSGGGKGANQAIALSRLGVNTELVGRVGNDEFGKQLKETLTDNEVNHDHVIIDDNHPTGVAIITVEASGDNQIIVVSGANGAVNEQDLANLESLLPSASYLLLQLEIPLWIITEAIALAKKYNVKVILDPAPALRLGEDIYKELEIITPNLIEASQLLGYEVDNSETAQKAGDWFLDRGVKTVIITMGEKGVYCATKEQKYWVSTPSVTVVDTVGAGDAFNAGLTTALIEGHSLPIAIQWGVINGSLSVTKSGSQSAFAHRHEFDQALGQYELNLEIL